MVETLLSEAHRQYVEALPDLLIKSICRILGQPDYAALHELISVYRVKLAHYVRLKVRVNRRFNNHDRYSADVYKIERTRESFELDYLAVDQARSEKNRLKQQLIDHGVTLDYITLINRGVV